MSKLTSQELIDRILILDAVTERFSELFPDRELLTLSAPGGDPVLQIAALQNASALLSALNEK